MALGTPPQRVVRRRRRHNDVARVRRRNQCSRHVARCRRAQCAARGRATESIGSSCRLSSCAPRSYQGQLLQADPWLDRCRLRRHRDEPALRTEDGLAAWGRWFRARQRGDRDHLASDLCLDLHRDGQIRPFSDAGRQQGRGRDALADGPGPACAGAAGRRGVPARRDGSSPVLGRRHHHTGHLGLVRRRGPRGRRSQPPTLRDPDHGCDPDRAFLGAEVRNRAGRFVLRPHHGGVLRADRLPRHHPHRRRSDRADGVSTL